MLTTLLGLPVVDAAHLGPVPGEAWPETPGKIFILYLIGIVGGEGLRRKFRTLMGYPEISVRWLAATIARWRKHPDFLQEMFEAEQDEGLRASLQAALHALSTDQSTETPETAETAEDRLEQVRLPLKPAYREQIMATAWADEWLWLKTIEANNDPEQGETSFFQMIWSTPEHKASIYYIEDDILNLAYLLVKGKAAKTIAICLRVHL